MANKPSINLDRINEGDSITITKSYNGTGKLCSNGNTMFGVLEEGKEKNLFIHSDVDTRNVIDHLNNMDVNTSVTIASNRGGGYSLDGTTVESAEIKKPHNTDLAIKWGMAFNNATRLVASIPLHNDEGDVQGRVKVIESIMPEMFRIACSMPESMQEKANDLPF
jgi:hypothetical protein